MSESLAEYGRKVKLASAYQTALADAILAKRKADSLRMSNPDLKAVFDGMDALMETAQSAGSLKTLHDGISA